MPEHAGQGGGSGTNNLHFQESGTQAYDTEIRTCSF